MAITDTDVYNRVAEFISLGMFLSPFFGVLRGLGEAGRQLRRTHGAQFLVNLYFHFRCFAFSHEGDKEKKIIFLRKYGVRKDCFS